jgi:thiamine transporter 2/3
MLMFRFMLCVFECTGAATCLGLGWLRFNWQVLGEATLALCSVIEGTLLIMSAVTKSMVVAYILYVLFGVIYHTMITVAK